jgi:plastocyanin
MRALLVAALLLPSVARADPSGGRVTGRVVIVKDGKPVAPPADQPAYVYLSALPPARRKGHPGDRRTERITQRAEQFEPQILVIPVGSTVVFPNDDYKEHNVFSPTAEDQFDLGRYNHGQGKSHKFDDPAEIDVYCDIHKSMWAKVKVVDSAWIARVTDGEFTLTGVPPGSYKVVGWLPDNREVKSDPITVSVGATIRLADPLHLQASTPKATHTRRDGSPYPPY